MNKFYLVLVISFLSYNFSFSADTVLYKIVTTPFTSRELSSDYLGRIFLNTSNGIFIFDGNNLIPYNDLKIDNNDVMVSYKGEITSFQRLQKKGIIVYVNKMLSREWADYVGSPLNVWVAVSNDGIYWVLKENRYLLGYKIQDDFKFEYPSQSIRGIYRDNESSFVLTYNGLFHNGNRIFKEIEFSNSNFCSVGDSLIFSSNYNDVKLILKNELTLHNLIDGKEFSKLDQIAAIEFFENKIWFGGTKGIMVYNQNHLSEKWSDIWVNNFVIIEDEMWVCSMDGLYKLKNNELIKIPGIKSSTSVAKIGKRIFVSSFSGFWEWDRNSEQHKNLFKDTPYETIETASILNDDLGNLWIGTSDGLLQYSLLSQKIYRYFDHVEFNRRSAFKFGDIFYFGGVQGLLSFNPKNLTLSPEFFSLSKEKSNNNFIGYSSLAILLIISSLYFYRKKFKSKNEPEINEGEKLTFENIQEYIYQNLDTVNVDDIRLKMGLSKNAFYDGFDLNFNRKPKELINEIKKKKAIEILKKSYNKK